MTFINLDEQLIKKWATKACPQEYIDLACGKAPSPCRQFITFCVPTQCNIVSPKIVFPIQGRMWDTRKFLLRGEIVDYYELNKEPGFCGASYYTSVYLTEIWENYGDDGHTNYILVGYGLTTKPEEVKKYYVQLYE